jgi:predicted aspartyl protease
MPIAPSAITLKSTSGKLRALTSEIQIFIPNTDQSTTITAIWDTGATQTCITQKVVDELGLKPTGIGVVHTAGGEMQVNKYMVTVGLPPNLTIEGVEVPVVTLPDNKDALIGMDIITLGDFSVTNKDGRKGDYPQPAAFALAFAFDGQSNFENIRHDFHTSIGGGAQQILQLKKFAFERGIFFQQRFCLPPKSLRDAHFNFH